MILDEEIAAYVFAPDEAMLDDEDDEDEDLPDIPKLRQVRKVIELLIDYMEHRTPTVNSFIPQSQTTLGRSDIE